MCLRPLHLVVKNKYSGAHRFYKDGLFAVEPAPQNSIFGFHSNSVVCACGKCSECLKKRQADIATRAMREAAKRGSMCFLTLTYDEEHLPLSIRLLEVDKDSGLIQEGAPSPLVRVPGDKPSQEQLDFIAYCRESLSLQVPSVKPRVLSLSVVENENSAWYYEVTPSLHRYDVRYWLKKCRIYYKREFGRPLPDFSYISCGEYGPKTCRPHYHICLFGLSYKDCVYMASLWDYGFTNLKQVNAYNADGTSGFQIASRYVGKYISKGKFECDSVKCGQSEKPRMMMSRFLGNEVPEDLLSWYRCYDLFGKYDINTLVLQSTGKRLSSDQMNAIFSEVSKRSYVAFDNSKCALPRSMLIKIWYVYDKTSSSYFSSTLRRYYSASLQGYVLDDTCGQPVARCPAVTLRDDSSSCSEYFVDSQDSSEYKEKIDFDNLRRFYSKSIF